ncbi:MAG: lycopene cyclase, partial [Propionibacteriaceae bacterium]
MGREHTQVAVLGLGPAGRAAASRLAAVGEHRLDRTYVVLDTPALQRSLDLQGVRVVAGSVVDADAHRVTLADGTQLDADLVLDARGTRPGPDRAAQTAYGLVVENDRAAAAGGPWFMDWRRDHGAGPDAVPSFLYAVPLDAEHTLLEETCLVGR